jgi:hypothetical protein
MRIICKECGSQYNNEIHPVKCPNCVRIAEASATIEPETDDLCPHCGAKMVEYKHGLSKGLARALWYTLRIVKDCSNFEIASIGMDYTHRCNFQKLRYWGIVEKVGDSAGKGGIWRITESGLSFAKGEIKLQHFAWTYRGEVQRHEGELIGITDIAEGWKYRPEYAREAKAVDRSGG